MKLRFLCTTHREQLRHNHKKAISCWKQGFYTAENLMEQERWSESLSHIGCAFETADIVLKHSMVDALTGYEWLFSSSALLGLTFRKLDYVEQSIDVYLIVIDCFERQLTLKPLHRNTLMAYLKELHVFVESLAVPDGHFAGRHYSAELRVSAH